MKTEGLDDAFNVETNIVPAEIEKVQKREKPNKDHVSKDYEYTRGNLYSIIEKGHCLLYTSPSPRDKRQSRMPSSA